MESITFELCRALDDPLDRTLCIRVMFGEVCTSQRSIRLRRNARLGEALLEIDRLVLGWASPLVQRGRHIEELIDCSEHLLGEPF